MKYRIVQHNKDFFEIQEKKWWGWGRAKKKVFDPFCLIWVKCRFRTFETLEEAETALKESREPIFQERVVKEIEFDSKDLAEEVKKYTEKYLIR